jgi:hypothetical protein
VGRPYGRLPNRLQGRRWNHPDDDLGDDLVGNSWDELRDRGASHDSRHGSRAGARAVLGAVWRSLVRASAMFLVCPLGGSSAGLSTRSCHRSSVSFAHHAVSSPVDSLPTSSLVMPADIFVDRALVCFRFCVLSGCGSSRDIGSLNGSGCRCRIGPGAGRKPETEGL